MDFKLRYINTIARATRVPVEKLGRNPLLLWAAYKKCANRACIDVDVLKETVFSYMEKYEFLNDGLLRQQHNYPRKFEILRNGEAYRGDTMTSMGNFVRAYFVQKEGLKNISTNKCVEKIFESKGEEDLRLIKMAGLIHTEGNMIPVPLKFNMERSGEYASMDYWDITLYYLYRFMMEDDDKWLDELLDSRSEANGHLDESVYLTENWLDNFDCDWETFLVKNRLEMYVDKEMKPVEFWEGHLMRKRGIRELSEKEYWQAVAKICDLIEQRNKALSGT